MSTFQDAAYTMAAVSATVALFRALVKKGVLSRDEAVRAILDEAVARAIQAEAQGQGGRTSNDINRQSAEILKFIAEKL
jgi:polyhydroxyalkanoate synthesis regulator phasin